MNFKESSFIIIKNHNCPLYENGNEFNVLERSISIGGKPACLTLMSDLTEALLACQGVQATGDEEKDHIFNCSGYKTGCVGTIRLRYEKMVLSFDEPGDQSNTGISQIAKELQNFSIFKTLDVSSIQEIVSYFQVQTFKKGTVLLRKGDRGEKLYIILSGSVDVVGDYGVVIATLGYGEVFGEMSLLTGNPISSKVKVTEDTKIMSMNSNYFRMILNRYSPLQAYFSRLLVKRLAISNVERSKQFASGMAGNLSEISPTELLQALNITCKTGILHLNLMKGTGLIGIRDGEIIRSTYQDLSGEDAFFEILMQKRGNFKFEPGLPPEDIAATVLADFMYLLMEGQNRIDESAG